MEITCQSSSETFDGFLSVAPDPPKVAYPVVELHALGLLTLGLLQGPLNFVYVDFVATLGPILAFAFAHSTCRANTLLKFVHLCMILTRLLTRPL